jgi:hypothetical protein
MSDKSEAIQSPELRCIDLAYDSALGLPALVEHSKR